MQIGTYFEKDLMHSLEIYKISGPGENQILKDDFDAIQYLVNDKLLSSVRLIMHVLPHHLKLNTAHINTESSNSETGSLAFTEVETCSIKCNTMNIELKNKYMELDINRIGSF